MTRVAVMGSGSWGTAFGMILADAGGDVVMWSREDSVARQINEDHVNERYHPGIRLPAGLRATVDEREALADASLVVLAVSLSLSLSLFVSLSSSRIVSLYPSHCVSLAL